MTADHGSFWDDFCPDERDEQEERSRIQLEQFLAQLRASKPLRLSLIQPSDRAHDLSV